MRRFPVGAELVPGGVHFRVWAPASRRAAVEADGKQHPLESEGGGYFSGLVPELAAGARYKFALDAGTFPDPVSRFQPEGPHGPSQVVDPAAFVWTDGDWPGAGFAGQVIYEFHVGTFTQEGTWAAAARQLPALQELGVTLLEIMPVADFPGRFGWGYDGVCFFAPTRLYGTPDDFRAFVNEAHRLGLGAILDVVYNHFGPDGCYLRQFSPDYFSTKYQNEWGDPLNFDGPNCGPVREFFLANARYWIEEFHLDGLRLDATQQIFDDSPSHILAEVSAAVRAAGGRRAVYIVNENEVQHTQLVRPAAEGGFGMDSLWNDDWHHSAMVALTGRGEAYYTDYRGTPQEFISMAKYGYLYQGQRYKWQKARRGTPALDLHPAHFVNFTQNHDQVANTLSGRRLHELAAPGVLRAMTALLLLGPNTPMLFQGQEFSASAPFVYFADHHPELAQMVAKGRQTFLEQFPSIACLGSQLDALLCRPEQPETFERCKLDHREREKNARVFRMHKDLLALRRNDPVFREPKLRGVDGAVLGPAAFVLRFFGGDAGDRLLVINLGTDLHLDPAPEPLLAPPLRRAWATLWTSECPDYGGGGTPALDTENNWLLPGYAAVVLHPVAPAEQAP
ncbi:MAG TPA: malto-oligosyltrehalose trehalohydrolase [Chthoniobacteraceae bacterium]|nr:malto-oligosyltrehalose trehalohydrolase [Chthoniobacteraceae bacterium]